MTRKRTWLFLSTMTLLGGAAAGGALAADPPVIQAPSPPMCRSPSGTPIPCPPSSTPATGTAPTAPIPRPMVASSLPDLVVRDLSVNERCQIVVTLANQGPGPLPDNAWPSSLLAISLRGAVAGTVPLATVDPGHALRNPGGTTTYLSGFTVPAGGAPADAVADYNNKVIEANERNNTTARVLTCHAAGGAWQMPVPATPPSRGGLPAAQPTTGGLFPALPTSPRATGQPMPTATPGNTTTAGVGTLPDLTIRDIGLNHDCLIVVAAANLGPGMVPDAVWTAPTPASSSLYLTIDGRPWGGATIWKFDPARNLQRAGGTAIYASGYVVRGSAQVKASIDHTAQVAEANEGNNALERTLTCPGATPGRGELPDLVVALNRPMNGIFTVTNQGRGGARASRVTLTCQKEGHAGGGGGCPEPPGGLTRYTDPAFPDAVTFRIPSLAPRETHRVVIPFWRELHWMSGTYLFKALADAGRDVTESDEDNNAASSTLRVR